LLGLFPTFSIGSILHWLQWLHGTGLSYVSINVTGLVEGIGDNLPRIMDKDGWKIAVAGSAVDGRDGAMRLPYGRSASASTHQLNAVNPKPQPKLKHQVYYELIEADNRKKKLEFEVERRSRRIRLG